MSAFVTEYMNYVQLDSSEAPANYHRWACLSMLGAMLGRQVWLPFGSGRIYPNQYFMLMGPPATKKGTAINIAKDIMRGAGYARFAPDRASKEAFVRSMKQMDTMEEDLELLTFDAPAESYIVAGEFVDFLGQGDIGFLMTLTNLWDNLPEYVHPKLTGKDVKVIKPTVNILAGSTATTFSIAFPPESLGTGTLSRILLIHGEASGNKIAWPTPPDDLQKEMLIAHMKDVKLHMHGQYTITKAARDVGEYIYKHRIPVADERFNHYMERRHIHMIKLAMNLAASELRMVIDVEDIIRGNTMLAMAEHVMPKALGTFGASRYSDATNKVIDYILRKFSRAGARPCTTPELWKIVSNDLNGMKELQDILVNLKLAEKIQTENIGGVLGYVPLYKEAERWKEEFLDNNWLTPHERLL